MDIIAQTDPNWYEFHKKMGNKKVIFWTPTNWNIKDIKKGEFFFFHLKNPHLKVGGYGKFKEYSFECFENMWDKYEEMLGFKSKEKFVNVIKNYYEKGKKKKELTNETPIGCIVLEDCIYWEEEDFVECSTVGVEFSKHTVTYKYFQRENISQLLSSVNKVQNKEISNISFTDYAYIILKEVNKPMSVREIWEYGVKKGYDKILGSKGKTPKDTLSYRIYYDIDKGTSKFGFMDGKPRKIYLVENQNKNKWMYVQEFFQDKNIFTIYNFLVKQNNNSSFVNFVKIAPDEHLNGYLKALSEDNYVGLIIKKIINEEIKYRNEKK